MSYIKTQEEVQFIIEGGRILGEILDKLAQMAVVGVSAYEVDMEAERLIVEAGGRPAFKGYRSRKSDPPFPSTICASLNTEVVHGIATKDKILKNGDIFSIDIGMQYPVNCGLGKGGNGFFTDTAITVMVGDVAEKTKQLVNVTKKSLELAIEKCFLKNSIADIGKAVETYIAPQGYGIVRDLVGHGVGHEVHEEPRVPNYYDSDLESWKLEERAVIAIEPMITMGSHKVDTAEDGWSITTVDGSLSAHFEHTIIITKDGPLVVTRRPSEIN
ncbi:MAG: type I methionyl aminopeptidase [Candidatus Magasanikbacteria bacterium RIFOXYC12_FULL_33_11]|uniref:Methionine aminopeptidase n=1 Tax=Candidatus Magasanikbacteria bacterium RIFOXYC12_FULL_33_11 TaxID=1798701 RepID=A0A1F6NR37_9BACT|nr:MAG: type I methionyl aminopeptidase [Candidatus Magasanikbacteria bacterium RIFOXYC12_FULL_33_11]